MRMNKMKKIMVGMVLLVMIMSSLTRCAAIKDKISVVKGELIGQNFTITCYDDAGEQNFSAKGTKVGVSLFENDSNFNSEKAGFGSEVLDITINGSSMQQVGNTVIFEEKGLKMLTDYATINEINKTDGGGLNFIDRAVNRFKNELGCKKIILLFSQDGNPIGLYQGDKVYVTVPDDLPKMTRLNIDGKSLYIHRANYVIMDADLLK